MLKRIKDEIKSWTYTWNWGNPFGWPNVHTASASVSVAKKPKVKKAPAKTKKKAK